MLNIIWPLFIIISFIYAFFSGNIENVSNGIFTSLTEVVNLCLTFLGTMCLWNGIMEIAKRTTLIRKLTIFFRPLINFLFPELKENEQAKEEISMNMIANILGLGNAATPLGIKAMKTLQKDNKNKLNVNVYFDKYSFNSAYTNKCNCYKKLTKFFYVNSDNFSSVDCNYNCGTCINYYGKSIN